MQRECRSLSQCASASQIFKMQRVYVQSNEHFEVFTTVLAPQGRIRYRAAAEKMVVAHSYKPHWPDELELCQGDVILVLSKHEEERWFGRLQDGQQGYFPASCVMELGQGNVPAKDLRRMLSLRSSPRDSVSGGRCGSGHRLQAFGRGSRGGGGGGAGLDGGQREREGLFLVMRPQIPVPVPPVSQPQPQTHRSPGLLQRILSKRRKKSERQGATNGGFEAD
ncbi:rho guanine nucleotide exchange factor 26-like [Myripristis murdjan]|uniref:rho guanine nucleotide exchange factor 26-like n=1 Tax=Myripristis murdjan TaxID=586833 RepID=UPI00117612C1|nr:rho guanine nucleotide exchange factor 26-like [Myripristis murdjan]